MIQSVFEDNSIVLRPTVIEVNLTALKQNIRNIRKAVGSIPIMGCVKANAYGHGLIRTSRELLRFGVDQLGVAFLEEGIALRKAGITAPILVMGGIIGNQISHFIEYDLQMTASSVYKLNQVEETAEAMKKRAKVHLKLDTGMGRIGIRYDNAHALFEAAVRAKHCDLIGVFSHFATSHSTDPVFTDIQIERFLTAMEFFRKHSLPLPIRHIANSAAILQHREATLDMVRPGIMMYGVYPSKDVQKCISITPVLTFKSRVVYFKVVSKGWSIGYDVTWTAPHDTRIVTLPVGYGDGYSRTLSNNGFVLIHGKRYPIVGRMSMDQCMIDIREDSAFNDDEVVLIGKQGNEIITIEEIAEKVGTIPYEILTSINTRVPRKYIEEEKI